MDTGFHGTQAFRYEFKNAVLSQNSYSSLTHLAWHSHENPFLCLLLKGQYSESYKSCENQYEPFNVVYHPAGNRHQTFMAEGGATVFLFEFSKDRNLATDWKDNEEIRVEKPGSSLSWITLQLYREFVSADRSELLIEGFLFQALDQIMRARKMRSAPPWLARVFEFTQDSWRSNFTIGDVAKEVGRHPFHIARVFRQFHGITLGEYIHKRRVDYAKKRLQCESSQTLCELALELGFADQSHFSRIFKRHTGFSPGVWKKRHC